jgi:hypothetical protein
VGTAAAGVAGLDHSPGDAARPLQQVAQLLMLLVGERAALVDDVTPDSPLHRSGAVGKLLGLGQNRLHEPLLPYLGRESFFRTWMWRYREARGTRDRPTLNCDNCDLRQRRGGLEEFAPTGEWV